MAMSSRRRTSSSTSSNQIPGDLWAEILKRVPVKTLCQFRCVCKSWNSLLSSPLFSSLHLHFTATATATETTSSYLKVKYEYKGKTLYTLHRQGSEESTCSLDLPLSSPVAFLSSVIGVVHGVVCFDYSTDRASPFRCIIGLWNPAIRKYIDIPNFPDSNRQQFLYSAGLGFDSSKNDFKLVLIPCDFEGMRYYVFSVCEGVWRKGSLPHHVTSRSLYGGRGHFFNGTIHWLTYEGPPYSLLLFDCEREEFTTIDFPGEVNRGLGEYWSRLVVYDGLLQVLTYRGRDYEAWKMDEYGDATSWTKYEITPKDEFVFNKSKALLDGFVFKESMLLMDIGKSY